MLICVGVGALVSPGIDLGKQLIANNFDFREINWWNVGAAALFGAATGLALGLGGVAGGIVKGSLAAIGHLSVYQSVGLLAGIALGTNFVAGMGVYGLREAGNEETSFNPLMMLSGGLGQMFKGGLSFAMGGMLVGSGVWNIGKGIPNTINPILRAAAKTTATFIPNMLIDNIFNSF